MEKGYEQRIVEVFGIENYQGTEKEKLALAELASQMFLATDHKLGHSEDKKENFNKVVTELIGAVPTEEIPMSTLIATTTFGLSQEIFEEYHKARLVYANNQEAFDSIYEPVCAYAKEKYPELKAKQYYY